MTDGDFDDGYDDDLFDSEFWADEDEVIRVTNILMDYAATLDYAGIDGIASDGDEYEMGDLMIRARNMIANGSISASNIEFAVTNAEQSETHKQAARDSFERMQQSLKPVAVKDGQPVYKIHSAELWTSCIHAIVLAHGAGQSSLIGLAARTAVDNVIYQLPDATPEDFDGVIFKTGQRNLLKWMEEASYIYYCLTRPAARNA